MCADARHVDRYENDDRRGEPVVTPAGAILEAAQAFGQEEQVHEHRHRQPAPPAEEEAEAHELRALVVVVGEFRNECRRGNFVKRNQNADEDGERHEVGDRCFRAQLRRRPQEVVHERNRKARRVHQRMAAAPTRVQVVGYVTDPRIGDGVHEQRDENPQRHPLRGQPDHLAVEEQQHVVEAVALRAVRHRAEAVEQLRRQRGRVVRRWRMYRWIHQQRSPVSIAVERIEKPGVGRPGDFPAPMR